MPRTGIVRLGRALEIATSRELRRARLRLVARRAACGTLVTGLLGGLLVRLQDVGGGSVVAQTRPRRGDRGPATAPASPGLPSSPAPAADAATGAFRRGPRPCRAVGAAALAAVIALAGLGLSTVVGRPAPEDQTVVVGVGDSGESVDLVASAEEVARGMPRSAGIFAGMTPSCSTADGVVFRCTFSHGLKVVPGGYEGWAETLVDDDRVIVGGCRADELGGRRWTCYLGDRAVEERTITADLLGEVQPTPGVG